MLNRASVQQVGEGDYLVRTNLPPDKLSELSIMVFAAWLKFAMGRDTLGGKMLQHPTGRYARALRYSQSPGNNTVAIYADLDVAPESTYLETGHSQFDLKTRFQAGRSYPMHRDNGTGVSNSPAMWAQRREGSAAGVATVGNTGWILPAMPAYAPAKILADLAAEAARVL